MDPYDTNLADTADDTGDIVDCGRASSLTRGDFFGTDWELGIPPFTFWQEYPPPPE